MFFNELITKTYPNTPRIIGGDFNTNTIKMTSLSQLMKLNLCQDKEQVFVTHVNSHNRENSNQLDYLLTSEMFHGTKIDEAEWTSSDHRPIRTTIEITKGQREQPIKYRKRTAFKKNFSNKQAIQILKHPGWPNHPFMTIA